MATVRISELDSINEPTNNDTLIINDGDSTTRKITYEHLTQGLLNTGSVSQTKSGALTVTDTLTAGQYKTNKTITDPTTLGPQTINDVAGAVHFAAGATSLKVTNNKVTTNSVIIATVATYDTDMKSVAVEADDNGSFTLHADAAPADVTRVNFLVIN